MNKKALNVPLVIWAAFFGTSAIFVLYPQLDLDVAELFFTPGVGFEAKGTWFERLVHSSVGVILTLVMCALGALQLYGRSATHHRLRISAHTLGFLLLVLTLGPGLLVNSLLKENWGRARPVDITQFGGSKEFSRAFELSDQGGHSFPSGHVAAAGFLATVALTLGGKNSLWPPLALGYALLVAAARIASGGHFLSDTLTSLFIVLILSLMLYPIVFAGKRRRAFHSHEKRGRVGPFLDARASADHS